MASKLFSRFVVPSAWQQRDGSVTNTPDDGTPTEDEDEERAPLLLNSQDTFPNGASSPSRRPQLRRRTKVITLLISLVLLTLLVLLVLGLIFGLRRSIRSPGGGPNGGEKKDTPDYSKLPGPQPGLRNPSYLVRGRKGAVATEAEMCSQIGLDILKENGTATDAAISSALCSESAYVHVQTRIFAMQCSRGKPC